MSEGTERSFLEQAHLVVAGIRVFMHREAKPPAVEELAQFLKTTPELIYHTANRLEREGILRSVRTSFETKLYLRDPSKLRDLPEETIPDLDKEIEKKRKQREAEQRKLGAALSADVIKRRQAEKMAELERKMKEGLGKPHTPWKDE